MKKQRIKKLINEEIGVSKFAEEILERLKIESLDVDFEKERKDTILVSDALIKIDNHFYSIDFYVVFVFEDTPTYPVYNASIEIDNYGKHIEILLYLHDSFRHKNTSKDLFKNAKIKSILIHELHHLIRTTEMKKQKDFELKYEKTNPFFCYIFDIYEVEYKDGSKEIHRRIGKWGVPSEELIGLYYYLSKSELSSIIPELKFYKNVNTLNMFRKFEAMSYSEFSKYIQDNHNGRLPTIGEYNNVKKRIRYFFNKIRKLGVSE